MGEGDVSRAVRQFVLVALLGACAAGLPAQAVKVERFAFARLQELRIELLRATLAADAATQAAVAARTAAVPSGNPFADLAEALALARGIEIDDAFRLRAGLLVMALPEVVDPDVMAAVHVTVHAPRVVPEVGPCVFELELHDGDEVVRRARIAEPTELEDLLRFRATTPIDVHELPDGEYRLTVRTLVDGESPQEGHAVPLEVPVWVSRGFKARADRLPLAVDATSERVAHARAVADSIPESRRDTSSQAMLTAAVWQVVRSYSGEPRAPGVDPIADLEQAEAVLAALRADRSGVAAALGSGRERALLGFPIESADEPFDVGLVSVPVPGEVPEGGLPLVLVVPGAPTWNRDAKRPLSPRTAPPEVALRMLRLGGMATVPADHLVCVMESPGRHASASAAVGTALRFLVDVLPVDRDRVFLVGEREGGYAAGRTALAEPELVAGVALVAGGGFSASELERLGDDRILVAPAHGHPSTPALLWLAARGSERIEALPSAGIAWPIALGQHAREIEAFVSRGR